MRVRGVVQGVGFRPFVARLAGELGLDGWVRNRTGAVDLEVEGSLAALRRFQERMEEEAPPAATIEHVEREDCSVTGAPGFQIGSSLEGESQSGGLPADLSMCEECRRELGDPGDRRYGYAFLNCTACGPRYSIVRALPYDRVRTSMDVFPLCPRCREEYEDPRDRRYHAEPIACPQCGPQLEYAGTVEKSAGTAVELAAEALRAGQTGAIQGIGGFHLAVNARDGAAVGRLRERKGRGEQPLALMVRDLATAREFVELDEQAVGLLKASSAPIVLLPKRGLTQVGEALAPGNGYLGVLLPYSPMHWLLLHQEEDLDALVMTSGNRHGEPMATSRQEAREKLGALADFFLTHNREIVAAADDSVVRLYRGRALAIRRGRGYTPLMLQIPVEGGTVVAAGAELKAAVGVAKGERVWLGPHLGDVENLATLEALEKNVNHLSGLFRVEAEAVVHDAHPGYLSTEWAQRYAAKRGIVAWGVQHHRAHVASVLAEYGVGPEERVVAAVFDGTGYGDDGAIWGGEFFCGPVAALKRRRHLPYVLLPGGDGSARRPALAAVAHLAACGIDWEDTAAGRGLGAVEKSLLARQMERGFHCHATSSMGRLFDAAASLLGVRQRIRYEAQAAIEMEARAAAWGREESYGAGLWRLDELWRELLDDGAEIEARARRFGGCVTRWTMETVTNLCAGEGSETVVLAGGVFQNVLLLQELTRKLEMAGLRVLVPRWLPPNDGGLALGQLYLAATQCGPR